MVLDSLWLLHPTSVFFSFLLPFFKLLAIFSSLSFSSFFFFSQEVQHAFKSNSIELTDMITACNRNSALTGFYILIIICLVNWCNWYVRSEIYCNLRYISFRCLISLREDFYTTKKGGHNPNICIRQERKKKRKENKTFFSLNLTCLKGLEHKSCFAFKLLLKWS